MSTSWAAGTATATSSPEYIRARRRLALRRNARAYGFLAPNLFAFAVFMLYPLLHVARQSLYTGGVLGDPTYVGFENWSRAFADQEFRESAINTLQLTVQTVPPLLLAALLLALALRAIRHGSMAVRAITYLPSLAPLVLAGLIWFFVIHPDFGLLNVATRLVGLGTRNWLGDPAYALWSISMLEVWRGTGFWALFLLAALLAVSRELYEAAASDGAGAVRRFMHVTLPGIWPTMVITVLLMTMGIMQIFDSIFVLTNGGPANSTESAALFIYRSIFIRSDPGYGAVLSLLLLALILLMTLALLRALRAARPGR